MFGFGERWGTQRYPKILLVDFIILGSTTSPLSTRRQQLQRSSTSRSKCPDETSASCATVSTSITSILIVGIVGVALLSQSLEGKHVEIWSYFCAWAVGYANSSLYTVFQFILYMFFFFKCWKRARSEHQQSNGLHLRHHAVDFSVRPELTVQTRLPSRAPSRRWRHASSRQVSPAECNGVAASNSA